MALSRERTESMVTAEFVPLVRKLFGDNVVGVILYGSFLKDSFTPGVSDVNVLVVLNTADPASLRSLGREGYRMMRKTRITPLVLTRAEFVGSSDVFPMEYMDIVDTHRLLEGEDVTTKLALTPANFRHEVEHQLRGSLVSLRQLAVAAGRKRPFWANAVRRELQQWFGSLSAVLRGLLRLKEVTPIPQEPAAIVEAVNAAYRLEPGPILELLRIRENKNTDPAELIDALLERLGRLVETVDTLDAGGGR